MQSTRRVLFTNSPDGARVAYDCSGTGPAIVLLHGGGGSRQEWHQAGSVNRLRDNYTESLSQKDQDILKGFNIAAMLGWVRAMLDWGSIEPADFRRPTLWLVGSEDRHAMASVREYEEALEGSRVSVSILEGLNHEQVFEEIDRALPVMLAFTQA